MEGKGNADAPKFTKRTMFNRPKGRPQKRKDDSDDESSSDDETRIVRKERKLAHNPLVQQSARREKVKLHEEKESNIQQQDFAYSADRSAEAKGPGDMGATATLEIETPHDRDAQALFEKAQIINEELKEKGDDNVYRGLNVQLNVQLIQKKGNSQGNASSGLVRKGPIRAPTNVRASVRWDYAPDICKDYKETGFCGFGDSCIFLHDRSDYKHGWQLEREVDNKTYGKNDADAGKYEIPDEEDELPFKCLICREAFKTPVVTKCKHYFCESCALSNYKKSKRCFACNQQTMGVFNPAKDLMARLKKAEESGRMEEEKEQNEGGYDDGETGQSSHQHTHSVDTKSTKFGGEEESDEDADGEDVDDYVQLG